jgi:hypothetical protein
MTCVLNQSFAQIRCGCKIGLCLPQIEPDSPMGRYCAMFCGLDDIIRLIWGTLADFFQWWMSAQVNLLSLGR